MSFSLRPGCPMCGIVSYASTSTAILTHNLSEAHSRPLGGQLRRGSRENTDVLYRDDNFTVYEERDNPVSSKGHIVICFNLHVPSIYTLSSSDVPLLIQLQDIAVRLLSYFTDPSPSAMPSPNIAPQNMPPPSPISATGGSFPGTSLNPSNIPSPQATFHVGFITPPLKDPKIPISDHLHAHAFIGDMDKVKWYEVPRKVAFTMGWWDIADLIAEIREQTSNNRVKSGAAYNSRSSTTSSSAAPTQLARPINRVPGAGTREGLPNGFETTTPTIRQSEHDLEGGRAGAEDEDDHEEVTLSPPIPGAPRIMTTSPPPLEGNSGSSNESGSGSGQATSEWSVISHPMPRPANETTSPNLGSGEASTSRTGTLITPPPPERPISALEI